MIRKYLLTTGIISILATSIVQAKADNFSGLYSGIQLGYGSLNDNGTDKNSKTIGGGTTFGGSGIVGGLHIGGGREFPNRFYVGLEGYGNFSNQEMKAVTIFGTLKEKKQYSIGLKLRPGVVFGNAMIYGILGADYSKFKEMADLEQNQKQSKSKGYWGFVPGVGIAFKATDHVILGLELTHTFHEKVKSSAVRSTEGFMKISYKL